MALTGSGSRIGPSRQESGTLKSHYGSLPIVYAYIWRDLQITTLASARIDAAKVDVEYFLMAIYWLHCYPTESVLASRFGVCERRADCARVVPYICKRIQALKLEKVSATSWYLLLDRVLLCCSPLCRSLCPSGSTARSSCQSTVLMLEFLSQSTLLARETLSSIRINVMDQRLPMRSLCPFGRARFFGWAVRFLPQRTTSLCFAKEACED